MPAKQRTGILFGLRHDTTDLIDGGAGIFKGLDQSPQARFYLIMHVSIERLGAPSNPPTTFQLVHQTQDLVHEMLSGRRFLCKYAGDAGKFVIIRLNFRASDICCHTDALPGAVLSPTTGLDIGN
jgi:hypothetical protein